MKKTILVAFIAMASLAANAQQNSLLNSTFWQSKPDVAAVKAEVEKGNNPSQMNGSSFDPVVMAINADAPIESIKYLLTQPGNDINKTTHDSRNYLHWAASKGNSEIIEFLLAKGAKTNNEDSHGSTPILFAAGGGQQNTKVYDLLIAKGVDLKKAVNSEGANALLLAISSDPEMKLTDYFVSKGLSINSTDADGNNAFSYAARSGNMEMLKMLQQKGIKPNSNAMLMAAQGSRRGANSLALFQYLESLKLKADVTGKDGQNALHSIVRRPGQDEIIQYFLAKGVDVNQADEEGNSVFMNAAASNRDTAVLELLLPKVKNINQANQKGLSALSVAVRGNSPEVVGYLIRKGADVKILDKAGNSLAFYAVESYRPQSTQPMAAMGGRGQGSRPGAGATAGPSASQGAGQGGLGAPGGRGPGMGPKPEDFDNKIKSLQTAGLDLKALQENGSTLFHLAIAKNDVAILKRLQALGLDVNAKDKEGFTPLHKAALIAKDDVVLKYLVEAGAKKDAATSYQETAFDLASENETLKKNNVLLTFLK